MSWLRQMKQPDTVRTLKSAQSWNARRCRTTSHTDPFKSPPLAVNCALGLSVTDRGSHGVHWDHRAKPTVSSIGPDVREPIHWGCFSYGFIGSFHDIGRCSACGEITASGRRRPGHVQRVLRHPGRRRLRLHVVHAKGRGSTTLCRAGRTMMARTSSRLISTEAKCGS